MRKRSPPFRRSLTRDYRQHFETYIIPKFGDVRLAAIGAGDLTNFRVELLGRGLSAKTVHNIVDGSFRVLWKEARAKELIEKNPFGALQWPSADREKADSFTAEEQEKILAFFREREPFYYPWVLLAFTTGMRPSKASALLTTDVDMEGCEIRVSKSRHLGADATPKTVKSRRVVRVPRELIEALLTLPSRALGAEQLFLDKRSVRQVSGCPVCQSRHRTLTSVTLSN